MDNIPPRALPFREATFYSSGRTWISFRVGHLVPANADPGWLITSYSIPFSWSSLTRRVIALPCAYSNAQVW